MSKEALAEGQQVFASGQRIEPAHPVTLAATVREAAARFGPRAGVRRSRRHPRCPTPTSHQRSDEVAAGLRRRGRRPR